MKVLIFGNLHHKNKIGLEKILLYLQYDYLFSNNINLIEQYDIIYSPSEPINIEKNKKYIFGPHFSVFPCNKLNNIVNYNNVVYIQPSEWAKNAWSSISNRINIQVFSFAVDTDKFIPIKSLNEKTDVIIYFKHRNPEELKYIYEYLLSMNEWVDFIDSWKKFWSIDTEFIDFTDLYSNFDLPIIEF